MKITKEHLGKRLRRHEWTGEAVILRYFVPDSLRGAMTIGTSYFGDGRAVPDTWSVESDGWELYEEPAAVSSVSTLKATETNNHKQPQPHERLISVAAKLARGPSLDERFDLDGRLPKWALDNIERICDRQRELACIIRDNTDLLRRELLDAQKTIEQLKSSLENSKSY